MTGVVSVAALQRLYETGELGGDGYPPEWHEFEELLELDRIA